MKAVEIFTSISADNLKRSINAFCSNKKNNVVDIKYAMTDNGKKVVYSAMIICEKEDRDENGFNIKL